MEHGNIEWLDIPEMNGNALTKQSICDIVFYVIEILKESEVIIMRVERIEIVIVHSMMTSVSAF